MPRLKVHSILPSSGSSLRGAVIAILAVTSVGAPDQADARPVRIDFANDLDEFVNQGSYWPSTGIGADSPNKFDAAAIGIGTTPASLEWAGDVTITNGDAVPPGDPDYAPSYTRSVAASGANVGGTAYSGICTYNNGIFALTTADVCGAAADPLGVVFSVTGGVEILTSAEPFATDTGAFSYARGLTPGLDAPPADPLELFNEALPTLRLSWNRVSTATDLDALFSLQALIYFLEGGDFDVEFRYGGSETALPPASFAPNVSIAGVATGFTGPLAVNTTYSFSFRDGVLLGSDPGPDPDPVEVPEPGTWALMLLGLGGMAWKRKGARRAG